jgi:hypothetical protein
MVAADGPICRPPCTDAFASDGSCYPLQDHDLVPEGEDLGILGPVAHRQQPQLRLRVGHAEVGQSKQHDQASSPNGHQRYNQPRHFDEGKILSWWSNCRDQGGRHCQHPQGGGLV